MRKGAVEHQEIIEGMADERFELAEKPLPILRDHSFSSKRV
jgi:hypothetical protein